MKAVPLMQHRESRCEDWTFRKLFTQLLSSLNRMLEKQTALNWKMRHQLRNRSQQSVKEKSMTLGNTSSPVIANFLTQGGVRVSSIPLGYSKIDADTKRFRQVLWAADSHLWKLFEGMQKGTGRPRGRQAEALASPWAPGNEEPVAIGLLLPPCRESERLTQSLFRKMGPAVVFWWTLI